MDALRASPQGSARLTSIRATAELFHLHAWRRDDWKPALESAGLPHLVPYSMQHTVASFAIAAGVSRFYLSRLMGSSVEQIDRTYGHMLPQSEEYLRGLLNSFDLAQSEQAQTAVER